MAKQTQSEPEQQSALVQLKNKYPALSGGGDVSAALEANLGGEQISVFDLQRIKVPSGGVSQWVIVGAGEDGADDMSPKVEGIVVFAKNGRTFWRVPLDEAGGSKNPPDCSSPDGFVGIGNPGIRCAECPMSMFGSREMLDAGREPSVAGLKALNSKTRPACSQQKFVFILREGSMLPSVIVLPPTSVKPMRDWLVQITMKDNKPYWCFVAKFSLVKVKSASGIEYCQARVSTVRPLTADEVQLVQEFAVKTRETFAQYREGLDKTGQEPDANGSAFEEDTSFGRASDHEGLEEVEA